MNRHIINGKPRRVSACAVMALVLSGCARQTASADRDQPAPISVRVCEAEACSSTRGGFWSAGQ